MTSVPGFLTKTFEIFSSPEYADCCGWGPTGETIIIRKVPELKVKFQLLNKNIFSLDRTVFKTNFTEIFQTFQFSVFRPSVKYGNFFIFCSFHSDCILVRFS
jgi:hypothetical protein